MARMNTLTGKVALVTGASSGIGEATALALASHGASVALVARRAERLGAIAKRITDEGGRAEALVADVADEKEARGVVEAAHVRLGRLDIIVNNAGLMLLAPVADASVADWRRMIEINLFGLMIVTSAALGSAG